jgi:hypothetical protein
MLAIDLTSRYSCCFSVVFLGILCITPIVGIILCIGLFCGCSCFNDETTKICLEFYLWITDIHGQFWYIKRSPRSSTEYVFIRSVTLHLDLPWQYVPYALPYLYQGWTERLCPGHHLQCGSVGGPFMVSGELSSWWYHGTAVGRSGDMYHASTYTPCLLQGPSHVCFSMSGIRLLQQVVVVVLPL